MRSAVQIADSVLDDRQAQTTLTRPYQPFRCARAELIKLTYFALKKSLS